MLKFEFIESTKIQQAICYGGKSYRFSVAQIIFKPVVLHSPHHGKPRLISRANVKEEMKKLVKIDKFDKI